jgi:hypothetical protein
MVKNPDQRIPTLKAYIDGPSVMAWCPSCSAWHSHDLTEDLLKSRGKSHRPADCGHYPKGYYLQLFTRSELSEISSSVVHMDNRPKK